MKVVGSLKTIVSSTVRVMIRSIRQGKFFFPLLMVSIVVVLIETLLMDYVVYRLGLPDLAEVLIDIVLLTLLYFPVVATLWNQMEERRNAENEARKSQELLERMFSISDILIAYLDNEFNFLRVNQAFALADGRQEADYNGKNYFDLYPDEDARKIFQSVVNTGLPYLVREKPVYFLNRPERGVSYWDWSLMPVKDIQGTGHGLILSLVDATRRRQAVQELGERNQEIWLRNQILAGLNDVGSLVNNTLDRDEILAALKHRLKDIYGLADGAIYGYDASANTLCTQMVWGQRIQPFQDLPADNFVAPQVISGKQIALLAAAAAAAVAEEVPGSAAVWILTRSSGVPDGPLTGGSPDNNRQATVLRLIIPLLAQGQIQGILDVYAEAPVKLIREQLGIFETFGREVGAALYNARLYQSEMYNREQLQALSRRLVEVQENERQRIVRELHDEVGQALTSLNLGLRMIEHQAGDPAEVAARCQELRKTTASVQQNLHRLAVDLRPAALDYLGLVPALRQHAETVCEQHGLKLQFEALGITGRLPDEIEIATYRIVQEALTNILNHASATRVDILLEQQSKQLVVVVEDNGVGFNPTETAGSGESPGETGSSAHLGILGMRERAKVLGGTLTIESTPGQGTTILVEVPYVHPNPDC